jgi:hypothetical protein
MKISASLVALFAATSLAVSFQDPNGPQVRSDEELAQLEQRDRPSDDVLAGLQKRGCGPGCACNAGYCECDICNTRGMCDWYYDGYNCNGVVVGNPPKMVSPASGPICSDFHAGRMLTDLQMPKTAMPGEY